MDSHARNKNSNRLLQHVFANGTTGCAEWTGALDADGYGRTTLNGKTMSAHRAAWLLAGFDLPAGNKVVVSHTCGNRRCINVLHLEVVSQGENIAWSHRAGRYRNRRKPTKVTHDTVETLRHAHAHGHSIRELMVLSDLSFGCIADIVANRSHVARVAA